MRIGFITDLSEDDFRFAAGNDIRCVEYNFSDDMGPVKRFGAVKGLAREHGVDFSAIGLFGRNHISSDESEAKRNMRDAKALIDLCGEMEAPRFVTGAGHPEGRFLEDNCDRAIPFFGELIDYAKDRGVDVLLYNCSWGNFAFSPEAWEIILRALPELGLKYDPSHAFYDDRDYLGEIADWGERIRHFHAKGGLKVGDRRLEDPPAGLDQIDWGSIMALLYHHGYDGDINIEPHSGVWLARRRYDGILLARRHLLQFLDEEP